MNKIIVNIMTISFFSCYAATKLISKMMDVKKSDISILDRFRLFMHLKNCETCSSFQKQLLALQQSFALSDDIILKEINLDNHAKERINVEITKKIENHL